MITIRIEGPQRAGKSKLAARIAQAERMSGKVVAVYDYEGHEAKAIPRTADVVIIVVQTP